MKQSFVLGDFASPDGPETVEPAGVKQSAGGLLQPSGDYPASWHLCQVCGQPCPHRKFRTCSPACALKRKTDLQKERRKRSRRYTSRDDD